MDAHGKISHGIVMVNMILQKNYWLKVMKEKAISVLAQSGFEMKILKKLEKKILLQSQKLILL